jgi:hypothetical protein
MGFLTLAKRLKNAGIACNRMESASVYTGSEIGGLHVCIAVKSAG